jgi:hypothetical protein
MTAPRPSSSSPITSRSAPVMGMTTEEKPEPDMPDDRTARLSCGGLRRRRGWIAWRMRSGVSFKKGLLVRRQPTRTAGLGWMGRGGRLGWSGGSGGKCPALEFLWGLQGDIHDERAWRSCRLTWSVAVTVGVVSDYKRVVELDPSVWAAREKIPGLERVCAQRMEKLKEETMGTR